MVNSFLWLLNQLRSVAPRIVAAVAATIRLVALVSLILETVQTLYPECLSYLLTGGGDSKWCTFGALPCLSGLTIDDVKKGLGMTGINLALIVLFSTRKPPSEK